MSDQSIAENSKALYELCGIYRVNFSLLKRSLEKDLTIPDNLDIVMRNMKIFADGESQLRAFVLRMQ